MKKAPKLATNPDAALTGVELLFGVVVKLLFGVELLFGVVFAEEYTEPVEAGIGITVIKGALG